MVIEHFNPELAIQEDSYLWRYMSIEKVLSFFSNDEMYFSRLDKFEDPLEGLPLIFRGNLQVKNVIRCEEDENNFLDYCKRTSWLSTDEIKRYQNGTYVSCWYLTENEKGNNTSNHHESLAMWKWQDEDSFVIKIKFRELLSLISEALLDYNDKNVFAAKYGKIHYLNYGEYAKLLLVDRLKMPSFIKHNSYKYENEIRFVLLYKGVIDSNIDEIGVQLKMKRKFNNVSPKIELFSHPNMSDKKFKIYKKQLQELGFGIKVSSIVSKQIINGLIK